MECGDCESYPSRAETVVAQVRAGLDFEDHSRNERSCCARDGRLVAELPPFLCGAILVVGERVDGAAGGDGLGVADFLNGRGNDGSVVFGVAKFEVHTAANVLELEHGTSPGGAGDSDLNRVGAEFGMSGNESVAAPQEDGGVA